MTILYEIKQFLRISGMAETRFGREAANDPRLVGDLRRGREPRLELTERLRAYMSKYAVANNLIHTTKENRW